MKKGLMLGVCFLFIIIVLMSFVSAGFFSDVWSKITGKVTYPLSSGECPQSDADSTHLDGKNYYDYGIWESSKDTCISSTQLREFYCYKPSPTTVSQVYQDYNCPSGYICSNGACVRCLDSDNGNYPLVGGNCTDSTGLYVDRCFGQGGIYEYVCSSGKCVIAGSSSQNCLSGTVCTYIATGSACVDSSGGSNTGEIVLPDNCPECITIGENYYWCGYSDGTCNPISMTACINTYPISVVYYGGTCPGEIVLPNNCPECLDAGNTWCDNMDGADYCDTTNSPCGGRATPVSTCPGDCGDGILNTRVEECDDGNTVNDCVCLSNCINPYCGDGLICGTEEKCDNGTSTNSDTLIDACRTDCKLHDCGDDVCDSDETCDDCSYDCGSCWEGYATCEECVGGAYTWCEDLDKCVNSPSTEPGCDDRANYNYECGEECQNQRQEYLIIEDSLSADEDVKKLIYSLESGCGLSFEFGVLNELPSGYSVPSQREVLKILNITSNAAEAQTYMVDLTLNESELDLKSPIGDITIYVEEANGWVSPTEEYIVTQDYQTKIYTYRFSTTHFSLFLITEPALCGNGYFDVGFEKCDGSFVGVTNCTAECVCESGYIENASGFCLENPEGTECSVEGEEDCTGYTLYECDDDLEWENKGKVVGSCGVECYPIGNISCQGEIPLRCGSDYDWAMQSKIDGVCGYTVTLLGNGGGGAIDRCGNGYCNYDEDEDSCPEDCEEELEPSEINWVLVLIIGLIALLIIIIVIVLFKIYNKEKRRPQDPNRNIPPEHRPGPKRDPGRPPMIHHGEIGRPPERRISPGGYAVRRYPPQ